MKSTSWKWKTLILTALVASLCACGGGGGGGGSSSGGGSGGGATPGTPITDPGDEEDGVADTPDDPGVDEYNEPYVDPTPREDHSVGESNSYAFAPSTLFHDAEGKARKTGIVGIIDTSFNAADLQDLTGRIQITKRSGNKDTGDNSTTGNGYTHGENVALVIGGTKYGDPDIYIYAIGANNSAQQLSINSLMYHALHDAFVRIYNQSFGEDAAAPTTAEFPSNGSNVLFYRKAVNPGLSVSTTSTVTVEDRYDTSLFIWATGNEGKNSASPDARLPALYPELERGWLAVTAVDTPTATFKDANPGGRSYGNAVGEDSKWWGIASYGDHYGIGTYAARPSMTTIIAGTSFATPDVTRTAARIQNQFPWMNTETIRLSLLTTATNIYVAGEDSATGVDAEYGWGLLNDEKALKGPAAFWKRLAYNDAGVSGQDQVTITMREDRLAGVDTVNKVFQNDIKGDAGLRFLVIDNGDGAIPSDAYLVLNGVNSYTGNTTVEIGTLIVSNKLEKSPLISVSQYGKFVVDGRDYKTDAPRVAEIGSSGTATKIESAGILEFSRGGGKVYGDIDVQNTGTLLVYNGGLTITGDITLASGAAIKVDVCSTIQAGGAFDFSGNVLNLTVSPTLNSLNATTYMNSSWIKASSIVGYSGDQYALDPDAVPYISVNPSGAVTLTSTSSEDTLSVTFTRLNTDEVAKNLSYTPASVLTTAENLENTMAAQAEVAGENEIKQAAAAILSTPAAYLPKTWDSLSGEIYASLQNISFKQAKTLNRTLSNRLHSLADADQRGAGVWFDAIGNRGKIYQRGWAEGKTKIWGGQAGYDHPLTDRLTVGAALQAAKSKGTFDHYAGTAETTGVTLSGYGKYHFENGFYALGRLGIGWSDVDVHRSIYVHPDWYAVKSKHKDTTFSLYGELGYQYNLTDNFRLTPYLGISHDTVKRGKFEEKGHAFGLKGASETYSQTAGVAGIRAQAKVGRVKWNAHVSHTMAFNKEDLSFKASVPADTTGTLWKVRGVGLPRNSTWIGIGAEYEVSPKLTVNAGYDVNVERKHTADHVVSVGFRYTF
jgi:outer membrane autotransporter protein